MKKLYIIGNGFDLMHGLPTSYIEFKRHCNGRIDELLNYILTDMNDDSAWNNFEDSLGQFDYDQYYNDTCLNTDAESWGEAAGVADDISETATDLVNLVKREFTGWISKISLDGIERKLSLDLDALYLNFNYTSTLQDIYKIPNEQIIHIHGYVDAGTDLIFGHGRIIEEAPEVDEYGDSNRHQYTDAEKAAKVPLYMLQKQVKEIITSKEAYFDSLRQAREIVVIGHSINEIDLPYFIEINLKANQPDWKIYYYNSEDRENFLNKMRSISVADNKVLLIDIKNESAQQGDAPEPPTAGQ